MDSSYSDYYPDYSQEYQTEYTRQMHNAYIIIVICVGIAFFLIRGLVFRRIFKKADQPTWAAFVPFYGPFVLSKLSFGNGFFFIIGLLAKIGFTVQSPTLSQVCFVVFFLYSIGLASKVASVFDKDQFFVAGLMFLPFIFYPILAFGSSYYVGTFGSGGSFLSTGRTKDSFQSDYYTKNYGKSSSSNNGSFYEQSVQSTENNFYGQSCQSTENNFYGQSCQSTDNDFYGQNTPNYENENFQIQGGANYGNDNNNFQTQNGTENSYKHFPFQSNTNDIYDNGYVNTTSYGTYHDYNE